MVNFVWLAMLLAGIAAAAGNGNIQVVTSAAMAGATQSISAVSYTHLDVYKRQHGIRMGYWCFKLSGGLFPRTQDSSRNGAGRASVSRRGNATSAY